MERLTAALGWSEGRLHQALGGNLSSLSSEDIHQLALRLHIDGTWLTDQISRATSTNSVMTEPGEGGGNDHGELTEFDAKNNQITVVLTEAGVNNGYIDIETRYAERLFPADCFGGRSGDALGETISLTYEDKTVATDLRVKSKAFVSPRKRFNGWFRKTGARAGDRVLIQLTEPRHYALSFVKRMPSQPTEVRK